MEVWMNSFKTAFSMYSNIPVPQGEWTKSKQKYVMCFFPLVGSVIGGLIFLWFLLYEKSPLKEKGGEVFFAAVCIFINMLVSGGIHADGFLDTQDALSSYADREKKLEILKDPRAGAFAVISGIVYFLLYFAAYMQLALVGDKRIWGLMALTFIFSRTFSGLSVVSFPKAKNTGLLAMFQDRADKEAVKLWMYVYIFGLSVLSLWISPLYGTAVLLGFLLVFIYYYRMSKRVFGGISGDIAGWFVQVSECFVPVLVLATWCVFQS